MIPAYVNTFPALARLVKGANHVDVKMVEGSCSLREFILGFIDYYPAWIKFLYQVRRALVPLIGLKQEGVPKRLNLTPDQVPFEPGKYLSFFKVRLAEENHYWVACAEEAHLAAYVAIVAEPLDNGKQRFYVITLVYYKKWTGVLYFNVIRPFHHVVVSNMARSGIAPRPVHKPA